MWFGTFGHGLNSFDGTKFKNYATSNSGLRDGLIQSLTLDRDGNLWVGTNSKGVGRFNPEGDAWVFYDNSNGLIDNKVTSIAVDARGRIWFGTFSGVRLYDGMDWYRYTTQDYARWDNVSLQWDIIKLYQQTDKHLPSDKINSMAVDGDEAMWFGTDNGVAMLRNEIEWEVFLTNSEVWSILVDREGTKWFGTDGTNGTSFYTLVESSSPTMPKPITIPCYSQRQLSSITDVYAIIEDSEGNLWVGTAYGPFRFDPLNKNWRCFTGSADLDRTVVQTIAADQYGNVWFGSSSPTGVTKYTANWLTFSQSLSDDINDEILDMARDQLGRIWIGTARGIACYDSGAWRSMAYFVPTSNIKNRITAIEVDSDGTLWLGSFGGGVLHIRPDKTIITLFNTANTSQGLVNDFVQALAIDRNFIWVGTIAGLSRLDRNNGIWKSFTMESTQGGLISNQIQALKIDLQGRLWVGTPKSMGGAFVAVADDGNAIYWNPAGLARMQRTQASFAYDDLFGLDIKSSYASFLSRLNFMPPLTT